MSSTVMQTRLLSEVPTVSRAGSVGIPALSSSQMGSPGLASPYPSAPQSLPCRGNYFKRQSGRPLLDGLRVQWWVGPVLGPSPSQPLPVASQHPPRAPLLPAKEASSALL